MNYLQKLLQNRPVEWKPLGEVVKVLNGFAFKSSEYSTAGIRVIRIGDVQDGYISDSDIKYYPIEKKEELANYLLEDTDLVMSLTGNVGRVAQLTTKDIPAGLNQRVACLRPKFDCISKRFLFHYLRTNRFSNESINNSFGSAQKNMSTTWLNNYLIPIPPMDVQEEIVRILDKYTELEQELERELERELELRQKQYAYYRDYLLTFGNEVPRLPLAEIANLNRGRVISKTFLEENRGQYPVYSSQTFRDGEIGRLNTYDYDQQGITWTTDGANAGSVFYREGKFSITNVCGLITIKSTKQIGYRFLYYWLSITAKNYVNLGMGNPKLMTNQIKNIPIPIPPMEEQERIVGILDKFETLTCSITEGLPREIELRQKQYAYYREQLLSFPQP